jgi:hypothetical protein
VLASLAAVKGVDVDTTTWKVELEELNDGTTTGTTEPDDIDAIAEVESVEGIEGINDFDKPSGEGTTDTAGALDEGADICDEDGVA